MRIERYNNSGAVVLGGMLLGGFDDFLMSEMHTIENTDCERQRTMNGGEGIDGAENLHAGGLDPLPAVYTNRKAGAWPDSG
jgi:hypothetical protein